MAEKKVTKKKFVELCKKYNLKVGDLPFQFPPQLLSDEKSLELYLKSISKAYGNSSKN